MKIFILTSSLTCGGAERVASLQANGLAKLGYEVFLLTDLKKTVTYVVEPEVTLLDIGVRGNPLLLRWRQFRLMYKLIQEYRPDFVISHLAYCAMAALEARMLLGGKRPLIIVADHNSYERPACAPMPRRQYIQKFHINRLYDYVTVLTHADKRYIDFRLKHVAVMPNPVVDFPSVGVVKKQKVVLAVGRIDAWHYKGFDLLIAAWNEIAPKHPDWCLRIVGAGSDASKHYLSQLCKVPNFELIDYTPAIAGYYAESSIFVLSSRYEGFGLVLTEAMMHHCACIACDYKGRQGEIIMDGENGLLCPVEDVESLQQYILRLIENEEFRHNLQLNADKHLERFSVENYALRWQRLLNSLYQSID